MANCLTAENRSKISKSKARSFGRIITSKIITFLNATLFACKLEIITNCLCDVKIIWLYWHRQFVNSFPRNFVALFIETTFLSPEEAV